MIAIMHLRRRSSRLPNKNFRLLGDKPLYRWALDVAVEVQDLFEKIVVYCSDKVEVPKPVQFVKRSTALDEDYVSGVEIIRHFAAEFPSESYCRVEATSPFVSADSFRRVVAAMGSNDSAFTVEVHKMMFWNMDGSPLNHSRSVMRSQDIAPIAKISGGPAAFSRELLIKQDTIFGHRPTLIPVPPLECLDIDELADWEFAEVIAAGLQTLGRKP